MNCLNAEYIGFNKQGDKIQNEFPKDGWWDVLVGVIANLVWW